MIVREDLRLEPGLAHFPDGIDIDADGITLDGNGATLAADRADGAGLRILGRRGVVVRNLHITGCRYGITISSSTDVLLENIRISGTAEIPPNTVFLDIFHKPGDYPGGVFIRDSSGIRLSGCDLSHQMCGLLAYDSRGLDVIECVANYCSGFGFYLSGTNGSRFENNYADFCCRWQPRADGSGHMGADAAGFVLVRGSSGNSFFGNFARMGGDGFFLAGLTHDRVHLPCNDNEFVGNDASYSPNISFEATFSAGNVFRENRAERSNYGFWLGFSRDNLLEANSIRYNRQAGIAVENGIGMTARANRITHNGHGVLLWSKRIPAFDAAVPENDTSRGWEISGNQFDSNGVAVRIAADQDHGISPFTANGACPPLGPHRIDSNTYAHNRVDIDAPDGSLEL